MNGNEAELPLSGVTVVSLEQAIAAPLASRHLADWGARVIKIERPGAGDFCRDYDHVMNGMSSQFVWTNRSKESLAIDIKSPEGRKVLDALLPRADVFIQNLAPGAAERLGLDAASLLRKYPRLIACDVSGYGTATRRPMICWCNARPACSPSTAPKRSRPRSGFPSSISRPACTS